MPGYYGYDNEDNPHKKSKKESIAVILLDGPDRAPDSDKKDMSPEDYAMSIADDDAKKEMSEMSKMADLPVEKIMEALADFDIPDSMLKNIEMHLRGEGC